MMEKLLSISQVILPILVAVLLGRLARVKGSLTSEEVRGLQQFAVQFGLPCVVFQSCLTAKVGAESLISMALGVIPLGIGTLLAFRNREKMGYHNLPMLFAAHETGMLGIPLTITLFGAAESYRMGMMDLGQAVVAYPVIAILSAKTGENPTGRQIVKGVVRSPLMIMSVLGLGLNLTGITDWMEDVGVLSVVTQTTSFLSQPVSCAMLFSVGYNFSMEKALRRDIFRVCGEFLGGYLVLGGFLSQVILGWIPGVEPMTRWVLLLYCALPASYLAPGLGKKEGDYGLASGVCSVLTVVTLVVFCGMCLALV